uniref:Uncharacterized protein n=1 Tax=Lepeophtheirus salmonis TaxID=72036 RepID=A0A0K2UPJ0_LEPSM
MWCRRHIPPKAIPYTATKMMVSIIDYTTYARRYL